MALKLSVKIGDVTNLSDARYAAGMGVDYIGFNINPDSEHFVTADTFSEIVNWISGVGIIGEVGEKMPEESENFGPMLVETSNPELTEELEEYIFRINTQNITAGQIVELIEQAPNAKFYVLELSRESIVSNELELTELCKNYSTYLSTNFNEALLDKVVNQIKPKGIEIKGTLEDQPGFKDYDGIADVLEWLEVD